jgi:outer membrane receptor protein involved in Fe transport
LVYANGNPLDPQRGAGYEGGLKILLLDNRLSLTAGGYELQRTNIPRTARDPAGNALLIPGVTPGTTRQYSTVADVRSKGYEFDANWQPQANLSLTLGVGYNNIRYTRVPNATEQYLLGNRPEGSPAWTGGTTVSYRFAGDWLKGFSVRASLRYSGDALINTGTSSVYGDSGVAGPAVTIGGQQVQQYYFRNHAYTVTGFGATYRWKAGRLNHAITLDVTNLFDKIYLQGAKPANPRGITLGYRLKL